MRSLTYKSVNVGEIRRLGGQSFVWVGDVGTKWAGERRGHKLSRGDGSSVLHFVR